MAADRPRPLTSSRLTACAPRRPRTVRRGQPNAGQTVAHFEVDDVEAVIRDLTSRGVTFEEYETPKTINFIAQVGPARGAWFKDPDGNVFGVREGPVPGAG